MRTSSLALRQQAYHALRDLTNAAYFADPQSWSAAGLSRPARPLNLRMSQLPDPIRDGLARGWKVFGGPHAALPAELHCDVAIVGSGAGAGITAELLTQAGPRCRDRRGRAAEVAAATSGSARARPTPALYQESAGAQDRPTRRSTSCRAAASAARPPSTGPARFARRRRRWRTGASTSACAELDRRRAWRRGSRRPSAA